MGRRTKCDEEVTARVVEAVKAGATYKLAAAAGGVDESTLHRWMAAGRDSGRQPYRAFYQRVKEAETAGARAALDAIQEAAGSRWQAAAWLLERRYGYTRDGKAAHQEASQAAPVRAGDDILSQLESALADTRRQRHRAEQDGSHVAARGYLDLELRLLEQVGDERAKRREKADAEYTPDQWTADLEEFAGKAAVQDLEVFVKEWVRRHPEASLWGGEELIAHGGKIVGGGQAEADPPSPTPDPRVVGAG